MQKESFVSYAYAERGACGRDMAMMMWQPSREVCRIEAYVLFIIIAFLCCVFASASFSSLLPHSTFLLCSQVRLLDFSDVFIGSSPKKRNPLLSLGT